MTQRSDIDRVLQIWMSDGPTAIPDRVVDVVAARIGVQPQRRAWPFPWRTTVNTQTKLIATLAAAIVLAVGAYNLLPRGSGPGGTTASPTPTIAPTPAAPTAAGFQDVPANGGNLTAGQWRFQLGTNATRLPVVANIPAGWQAFGDQHGLESIVATNSPPSGIAILFEMPAHGVFSDPCHWDVDGSGRGDQPGDVAVGPTAADLVGALRANTSYTSTAPTPVTYGPYSGQQLELTFSATLDPSTCDRDPTDDAGTYRVMPDAIYSQGKSNIWEMTIVDVAGTRVVVIIEHFPGTDPAELAEAKAIVDSFDFTQ
jgi:hypothetical protein